MRASPFVLLSFLAFACGERELASVPVPDFGTEHAVYGTAPAGRAISPSSLRVVRVAELDSVMPELIGGGDVDMMMAGLKAEDLPQGLTPEGLVFVATTREGARPLPPLYAAHIMDVPSPPEAPDPLVPVSSASLPANARLEREDRFRSLIDGIGIDTPCRPLAEPISVYAPRISADLVSSMHTLSNGHTVLGFSTTSTAIFGVLAPGARDPVVIGVDTGTVAILPGERAEVLFLSEAEVDHPRGVRVPRTLTLNVSGGFGSSGVLVEWDDARNRWVDRTPATLNALPRLLYGARNLELDGETKFCAYGAAQGADRRAAIWCRDDALGAWRLQADFDRAFSITDVVESPGRSPIAVDLAGTVYQRDRGRWSPIFESALNAGCDPLCAALGVAYAPRGDDRLLAILAGAKAQLLFVTPAGASAQARTLDALPRALFADERQDAEAPVRFTAATVSPDRAIWLGNDTPSLFRVSPDLAAIERICLPKEMRGTVITAISPHPNGNLLLGLSPAFIGFGDWRLD